MPAGRLPYRPATPGRSARSSPMAIPTMRAPGTSTCWRRARRSPSWSAARDRRPSRQPQAAAYGETIAIGDVDGDAGARRPRARQRAGGDRVAGRARRRLRRLQAAAPIRPAAPSSSVPCDLFITEATFGLPVFRHRPTPRRDRRSCCSRVALFPERAHLVGVYALGKCQRVIALLREAGYERPIYLHGALAGCCELYERFGVDARRRCKPATGADARGARRARSCWRRRRRIADRWSRRLPDPRDRLRLGLDAGPRARPPARRRAAAGDLRPCRLGRADRRPSRETGAERGLGHAWRARTRCCIRSRRRAARGRALALIGREDEDASEGASPSCSTALLYTPVAQRQAAAARRLFRRDARSRSRLGARRADRRAVLQAAAAPHPAPSCSSRASIRCCSTCPATMSATSPRPSR